jgi:hypothetical protein
MAYQLSELGHAFAWMGPDKGYGVTRRSPAPIDPRWRLRFPLGAAQLAAPRSPLTALLPILSRLGVF